MLILAVAALSAAERVPVFDPKVTAADRPQLERDLRDLLALGDAKLAALVPERNGLIFCGCPNCDAGTQDGQMTWLGVAAPGGVKCKFCQTVYPNDRFPEDQTRTVRNPRGEAVTYRYHRDAQGATYYFSANADYQRKAWLGRSTLSLAKLAHLTRDPAHARKAVILLDAFAEKYPGWCVMSDRAFSGEGPLDSHPTKPRPYYGGTWSRWFYYDIPADLLLAYDLVRSSPEWDRLPSRSGGDARGRLERDVFRAAVDFVRGYEEYLSNRSPLLYHGLVIAGRVVGEPEWVHDGVERFRRFMRSQFFFDGMWREGSVSYHRATLLDLVRISDAAKGYSDPAGYRAPATGETFRDLDLMREFPLVRKAGRVVNALTFPDGRVVPVHDAWAIERRGPPDPAQPTRAMRRPGTAEEGEIEPPQTALLNAMEHCVLHRGSGADSLQARLHFTQGNGHKHQDLLGLILWAGGRELASDLGYTHTAYRAWSRATAAHNTVVVNETEQTTRGDRADLTLFGIAPGLAQTVEATASAAYPRATSVYRRQLVQVDVTPEHAYVVDVFRVTGGDRHDWFLHGSADHDQAVTTSLSLTAQEGTLLGPGATFRLPTHERDNGDAGPRNVNYAFIRNVATATTGKTWTATFRYREPAPVQLRTTILGQPETTVVTAESPSLRRALENDAKLNDYMRPVVVARRAGKNLSSTFVAVHEPFRERPFIRTVRQLESGNAAVIAIEVECEGVRDVIVFTGDASPEARVTAPGIPPVRLKGRTALIRVVGGRVTEGCGFDSTYLECGDLRMVAPALPAGRLTGVRREPGRFAFEVAEKLPADVVGATILVTLPDNAAHGYRIRGLEATASGSVVELDDDPGFALRDGRKVDFLYFPQRELTGECHYRVMLTRKASAGHASSQ